MDDSMAARGSYDAKALRTLLLHDRELPALLTAYQELTAARSGNDIAEDSSSLKTIATNLSKQCHEGGEGELKELGDLLDNPHVLGLLSAFDGVEQERSPPVRPPVVVPAPAPPVTNGVHQGPETSGPIMEDQMNYPMKLVGLNKVGNEPLGLMLKSEGNEVKISRIMVGMGADRQGLLHVGDIIREVNGKPAQGSVEFVQQQLTTTATGTITLKVIPTYLDQLPISQIYMRAHFDYDPKQDGDHPFPSGGLAFKSSDVLQILTQDDQDWWQAKIEGGSEQSGLIPALLLEERRQAQQRDPGLPEARASCFGWRMRRDKIKPVMYSAKHHAEYDRHELNIYEEVARLAPGQRKTIVLIGAQGVGRRGLKQRLILSNQERFSTTLPHTTRPPRKEEEDGKHYWFTSEETMMADIAAHKFIEHGTYEEHIYGTKIDSVRAVIRSGKTCLLDVNPQALKRLRTSEFKPYVIFIKAPTFAVLKRMHQDAARTSTSQEVGPYSDEDLQRTLHESDQIEEIYRHFFDKVIVNDGIEGAYRKLLDTMRELESSPQWVPINWVF